MTIKTLSDQSLFREKSYINGNWCDAHNGNAFKILNPATGHVLGQVPDMGERETKEAIEAAFVCFKKWRHEPAKNRANILLKWYSLMLEHHEDLSKLMVLEQGKPLAEAKGETLYAASFIQWFAEQGKRIYGRIMADYAPDVTLQYTKEAIGVVGVITPWNFPLAMITRKIAPALAAGCTTVIKPSEFTPYSALALAELAERAGFPLGAINVVTGVKSADIGSALTTSKKVRKISFTGSTRVGKLLLKESADTVKKMSLELGGNAAFIVFDDADIPTTIKALMASKFRNSGQTCVCANRIFVQSGIHDKFIATLKEEIGQLKIGDGLIEGISQGPLINEAAVAKVEKHVQQSLTEGAKVICGGKRVSEDQTFYEPTLLTGVSSNSIFWREETFGPVAPITQFETDDEVVEMSNATDSGLATYFCTTDYRRINRMNRDLESGMIGVNLGILSNEFGPFGGIKESGLGREGSELGLDEYLEIKYSLISYQ